MINNNLKYAREELEMTQEELGFVFGVSKNTVSGWENAHDTMPFNKLIKFCNLYDYSLDFICGFTRKNIKYDKIKTNKTKIGKKLKELRKDLKLSQQALVDDCKFSQATYRTYETYNISMDYLVGRTNNKKISK